MGYICYGGDSYGVMRILLAYGIATNMFDIRAGEKRGDTSGPLQWDSLEMYFAFDN